MESLINRVQQQLDGNHPVEADDIQALVALIENAENVLIEAHKKIESGMYEGRLPIDDFDGLNSKIKNVLKEINNANT